jgi:hypothetical protein
MAIPRRRFMVAAPAASGASSRPERGTTPEEEVAGAGPPKAYAAMGAPPDSLWAAGTMVAIADSRADTAALAADDAEGAVASPACAASERSMTTMESTVAPPSR